MELKEELLQELQNTKDLYKKIENIPAPQARDGAEEWIINNIIYNKFAHMQVDFITKCNDILLLELLDILSDEKKKNIIIKLKELQESFITAVEQSKKKKLEIKSPGILVPK